MIKQNLAVYSIPILYEILKELEEELDYSVINISSHKEIINKNLDKYIILTKKSNNVPNEILITFPIKISRLIEIINIKFIKLKTKQKANINLGNYEIDLNARLLKQNDKSINLTEKEVDLIMYLSKSLKSVSIEKLQSDVWGYKFKLESHTVETHIHRLRKKIFKNFNKKDFIMNDKKGYYLNG